MEKEKVINLLYTIYSAGFNHGSNEGAFPEHGTFDAFNRLIHGESPMLDNVGYDIKDKVDELTEVNLDNQVLIKNLNDSIKLHIAPYNIGDGGATIKLIKEAINRLDKRDMDFREQMKEKLSIGLSDEKKEELNKLLKNEPVDFDLGTKILAIFKSGAQVRIEKVIRIKGKEYHHNYIWNIDGTASSNWFGFKTLEECIEDCLAHVAIMNYKPE